jgi:hypothetical protein
LRPCFGAEPTWREQNQRGACSGMPDMLAHRVFLYPLLADVVVMNHHVLSLEDKSPKTYEIARQTARVPSREGRDTHFD